MILWNTKILICDKDNNNTRMISRLNPKLHSLHLPYKSILHSVPNHIIFHSACEFKIEKVPRHPPYRLRTSDLMIDTYLTTKFLICKPNGEWVFRRLADIRKEFKFVCLINDAIQLQSYKSLIGDPAKMRMYDIVFKGAFYDRYVANNFIIGV